MRSLSIKYLNSNNIVRSVCHRFLRGNFLNLFRGYRSNKHTDDLQFIFLHAPRPSRERIDINNNKFSQQKVFTVAK